MKKQITRAEACEMLYNWKQVHEEIIDHRRWVVCLETIFEDPEDGTLWRVFRDVGATECQEMEPWEYEETVEVTQVEKRTVTTEAYVEVGE